MNIHLCNYTVIKSWLYNSLHELLAQLNASIKFVNWLTNNLWEVSLYWSQCEFYVWTAMPSEKGIPSYSPQHGDKGRCSFSPYCKFEMILWLFTIWLVHGDEIVISIKNMKFYTWTAVPSEKRILSYSSQLGNENEYKLSLCCKFEINLRLFTIWPVVIKLPRQSKYEFLGLGCRATWAKGSQLFLTVWWWRWMYT